jgi:hypothetical protein
MSTRDRAVRLWNTARADPEYTARIIVLTPIIVITFAVAASHTLEVGGLRASVTGWKAWSVAGTLEIFAAFTFFMAVRAASWRRIFPGVVFLGAAFLILWINLASIRDYSWTAIRANPFPAIFATGPAVIFLVTAILIEVDGWKRPKRRPAATSRPTRTLVAGESRTGKSASLRPDQARASGQSLVDELTLQRARSAITALEAEGVKVTGDTLRVEMGVRKGKALDAMEALGLIKRRKRESA